jgi:hypothetical protein
MASTYLTRTQTAGNRRTFTWSAWVKRGVISTRQTLLSAGIDGSNESFLRFDASDYISIKESTGNSPSFALDTTPVFRDPSAWYHIVFAVDTTQSTASDRVKLYVNGSQITSFSSASYPSQNYETRWGNNSQATYIGQNVPAYQDIFDGYMAHLHFTDGYAYAASTFGSTATNGQWVPNLNPSVTYGTNGYFLKFTNASDLGEDFSGNNNDFTKSGSGDKTNDNPQNNFATLNPLDLNTLHSYTISEGNTKSANTNFIRSNFAKSSGKWYCEVKCVSTGCWNGIRDISQNIANEWSTNSVSLFIGGATLYISGASQGLGGYGSSWSANEIMMMAVDLDSSTKKIYFGKNGGWWNGSDYSAGSPSTGVTLANDVTYQFQFGSGSGTSTNEVNFGNPPFSITSGNSDDNDYGNFEYAPPSGYLALCTQNLATELSPTIDDGSEYFNTLIWSGDNTTRSFTGLGFSPDWTWIKSRNAGTGQVFFDRVRGAGKQLSSDNSNPQTTNNEFGFVTSFDSDGFTTTPGSYSGYESGNVNMSGRTYVGWNWLGSNTTATNSNGSLTSTVSANQTSGFSLVSYNINTSGVQTVGHGLSKAPELFIIKGYDGGAAWWAFTTVIDGSLDYIQFDGTGGKADDTLLSLPTSTVFSTVENYSYQQNVIAYCFHSVEGYSKIGKYTGNGSTDGPFIYTGFKPAFVMAKRTDSANSWVVLDNKRNTSNAVTNYLQPNATDAEGTSGLDVDFTSNGFKWRTTSAAVNANGGTFIYMVFAENPFVDSSGIPVTAR